MFLWDKKEGSRSTHEQLTWYNLNNQLVLSQLQNGAGTAEAATTLGFLDLPCVLSFGNKGFQSVEMEVGNLIRSFAEEAMEESLLEEIKLTLEAEMREWNVSPHPRKKKPITFKEYLSLPKEMRPPVTITVCYDMGWQKRSSGNKYDSISGHAFMVGARCRKVLACLVCSKLCAICEGAKRLNKEPAAHKCVKNYEGSSKGMEAHAALELVKHAKRHRGFIVGCVVADDDSSMKALLRHSYTELVANNLGYKWPRLCPKKPGTLGVKLRDTGKLPLDIPEPSWLAESHP